MRVGVGQGAMYELWLSGIDNYRSPIASILPLLICDSYPRRARYLFEWCESTSNRKRKVGGGVVSNYTTGSSEKKYGFLCLPIHVLDGQSSCEKLGQ